MIKFYTFTTCNRVITIQAQSQDQAYEQAFASIMGRLVKADPFMKPETFERVQAGLEIEFASSRLDCYFV